MNRKSLVSAYKRMIIWLLTVRAWLRAHVKVHAVVALLVFFATFAAALYYWSNIRTSINKDLHASYQRQVRIATTAMTGRLQQYENLLRGGAGLFTVSDDITQNGWERYFEPYKVPAQYPEVQGIGFSRYLQKDEVPAYSSYMQARGREDFKIFPEGDRSEYVPVTFNAGYTGNNGKSIGYDGFTERVRHTAMEKAAASGSPVMSGKIELVSQFQPGRPAFIIYLPVYKRDWPTSTPNERKDALYGFVYIAVDMRNMAHNTAKDNQADHFGMQLFDMQEAPDKPVYQTANFSSLQKSDDNIQNSQMLQLYGHSWKMVFVGSNRLISASERQLPLQALWRGFLSSALFAGLVWYLITARDRKLTRLKHEEVQTAKDDLLSLASHQLRTPATVVKQYVGMLLQGYAGKLTHQQITMLDHAYESNERQLEIINQLLYVARLDAGRITLRYQAVDISRLLKDVINDQRETIEGRNQQIVYKPHRKLIIDADPHYLRMVLENLLSNASKYTPGGGIITLTLKKDKRIVVVTVNDNGVGIDEEMQTAIFDKFTRVENELSTTVNGSGVGLYLTRQIVELHGGTIEVDSVPQRGSTFTLRLPVRKPPDPLEGLKE